MAVDHLKEHLPVDARSQILVLHVQRQLVGPAEDLRNLRLCEDGRAVELLDQAGGVAAPTRRA